MTTQKYIFNGMVVSKQRNQSQCDRMKNINIRSLIISKVLCERGWGNEDGDLIVLDNSYKCFWYSYYKIHGNGELLEFLWQLIKDWDTLNNHVKQRSNHISKLRKELKKIKGICF